MTQYGSTFLIDKNLLLQSTGDGCYIVCDTTDNMFWTVISQHKQHCKNNKDYVLSNEPFDGGVYQKFKFTLRDHGYYSIISSDNKYILQCKSGEINFGQEDIGGKNQCFLLNENQQNQLDNQEKQIKMTKMKIEKNLQVQINDLQKQFEIILDENGQLKQQLDQEKTEKQIIINQFQSEINQLDNQLFNKNKIYQSDFLNILGLIINYQFNENKKILQNSLKQMQLCKDFYSNKLNFPETLQMNDISYNYIENQLRDSLYETIHNSFDELKEQILSNCSEVEELIKQEKYQLELAQNKFESDNRHLFSHVFNDEDFNKFRSVYLDKIQEKDNLSRNWKQFKDQLVQ